MNFTNPSERRLEQIDESIARYLSQLHTADRRGPTVPEAKTTRLGEKIAKLGGAQRSECSDDGEHGQANLADGS